MNIHAKEFVIQKEENDWNNIELDLMLTKEFQNYEFLFHFYIRCYSSELYNVKSKNKDYMIKFIEIKYCNLLQELNKMYKLNCEKIKNMYI